MKYSLRPFGIYLMLLFCSMSCALTIEESKQENEVKIISSTVRSAHSAYLTTNHIGKPIIGWTEQDTVYAKQKYFYFAVFDSVKNDFGDKVSIPIELNASLHTEGMPKVAFKKNGEIFAVFETRSESEFNPYAGEIHFMHSQDNGNTWSAPKVLHSSNEPHKSRSFFDVTTLSDGQIGACWLGESRTKAGRPVMFAKTNERNEFVDEIIVDSLACQCCRTGIYADMHGAVSIVYRDIINESIRDISVALSSNNGDSFSSPVCFSGDNWNINGCPHNGPDVISDKNYIYATWFTGGSGSGVYYAKLNKKTLNAEKQLISNKARNIQLAKKGGSSVVVYNESYEYEGANYARIIAQRIDNGLKIELSEKGKKAHSPVILEWKGNNIVSWLENDGDINLVAYSTL